MQAVAARPLSAVTSNNVGSDTTRCQSEEGYTYVAPFKSFYTSGEEVKFPTKNRFDGKSNFLNYIPTDQLWEQKLEKRWQEKRHRDLAEKRTQEEVKQSVKEWSEAKARYECELQRKKEHLNFGSNFEKARGYVRTTRKPVNPPLETGIQEEEENPLWNEDSSESEYDDEYGDEEEDDRAQTAPAGGKRFAGAGSRSRAHTAGPYGRKP